MRAFVVVGIAASALTLASCSITHNHYYYGPIPPGAPGAPAPAPAPTPPGPTPPAPTPPPPVTSTLCPPGTSVQGQYRAAFEFDPASPPNAGIAARLTPDTMATLDRFVSDYTNRGMVSVTLIGHTDTVGSATDNALLGQLRANAVRDYLTARGLAQGAITATSAGESQLHVPTGDGVREPLNNRVEIFADARDGAPGPCFPRLQ